MLSIENDEDMSETNYVINRHALNFGQFRQNYTETSKSRESIVRRIREKVDGFKCSGFLSGIFPFYTILSSFYTKRAFFADILAGMTMAILHVPQGMAYGYLAGLKPINGLYTSFFPGLTYFFFGTSRHISIGTFSVVALLSSEPVDRISASFVPSGNYSANTTDTTELDNLRLSVAITVAVLAGLLQLIMGIFHLGFLVSYISAPLLGGFTCASALHVLSSQLNGLFGIQLRRVMGPGRLMFVAYNFFEVITTIKWITLLLSISCITVLVIFKFWLSSKIEARIHFPFPIELIVLIIGTIVSYFVQLQERYGVAIVGPLPKGLPLPMLPDPMLMRDVLMESAIVSFVALATTVSLVKLYAARGGYDVKYTQEMIALGLANLCGGFFQCHAASGALARTSVSVGAGMQSQVATLISCSLLLLVLTVIGPLLQTVPMCVLSSLISVSLTGILKQVMDLPQLYRTSIIDMCIWLVAFFATALIDVPFGLIVGLVFSLSTVLFRTHRSEAYKLGSLARTDLYVNMKRYAMATRIPHLLLLHFDGPLYYANADIFRQLIISTSKVDPNKEIRQRAIQVKEHNASESAEKSIRVVHGCCPCKRRIVQTIGENVDTEEKPEQIREEAWANEESVLATSNNSSTASLKDEPIHFIIVDTSSWGFVDLAGGKVLCEGKQFIINSS